MISLNKAKLNQEYKIVKLNIENPLLRRFIDIGLVPGSTITKILKCPFGGISAYLIMESTMAIRDKDVEGVLINEV